MTLIRDKIITDRAIPRPALPQNRLAHSRKTCSFLRESLSSYSMLSRHFQHKKTYIHAPFGHDNTRRADTRGFSGLYPVALS